MPEPYRVLAVCTGNICRSPMAEVVLRDRFEAAGLEGRVVVDSGGTSSEESGNPIDPRAARVLRAAGYAVPRRSARRVTRADVAGHDLVLAATAQHARRLRGLAPEAADRVRMLRAYDPDAGGDPDLADPWYGDEDDFVVTLEQIEAAADGIVEHVRRQVGDR